MTDIRQKIMLAMSDHHSGNNEEAQRITDAILTALSAAGVDLEGWRPIETAPKDKTPVLFREGMRIISGYMIFYAQWNSYTPSIISRPSGSYSSAAVAGFHPTHWRPLPQPPEKNDE